MSRIDPTPGQRSTVVPTESTRVQHLQVGTGPYTSTPTRWLQSAAASVASRRLLPSSFYKRATWVNALKSQTIVVRNATGSIMCAWLANACYSQGNIFSGRPSVDQSRRELIVANSIWATITFCLVMLIARVPLMLPLRFIDAPDRRPSVWLCLKKLVRGTIFYFFATMAVMFACSSLIGFLTSAKPEIFKYKLDCYAGTLSTHGFFTGITLAAKRIYYRESCQGQNRLKLVEQRANKASRADATETRSAVMMSFRAAYRKKSFNFWRAYVKEFPKSSPAALAGVFVHVLSQQRIMERGATAATCFVITSITFKLVIQEITKHYIIKKRIRSAKFMCAAVALPTVLIDTQTRIIMSGTKNSQFVALGTLGMAVTEICLRVGKAQAVMRTIRYRETQVPLHRASVSATLHPTSSLDARSPSPVHVEFELWRRRLHAYHIAEMNADTYAEYIAIGCSASILFFFGDHPYYSLLRQSGNNEHMSQRLAQLKMLAFQVVVELVVDFISTALEMMAGIEFDMNKNLGAFLTVLFMVTAVLNINISMGIYLF